MLAVAGQAYEDFRFPISADFKRPEFDEAKASGAFQVNMDRIPILEVDGTQIGQSKTIERYIAKRFGFVGSSAIEEAQVDMITEHIRDVKQKYNDSKAGKSGDELAAAKTGFMATELPTWMRKIEFCVAKGGYAVGSRLSLADITIYCLVKEYFDDLAGAEAAIADCAGLQAVCATVAKEAKSWFETRPATKF